MGNCLEEEQVRAQELKQLTEHMDSQIGKRFDEYRKFDDYVKREVRQASTDLIKKFIFIVTVLSLVVTVIGWFGIPYIIKQKTQQFLHDKTNQAAMNILSNEVVGVVKSEVPPMIAKETDAATQALKADFTKEIKGVVQNAETKVGEKITKVNEATVVATDAANAANDKLAFIELVFSAMAGNRLDYDKLIAESKATNRYEKLAKNTIAEINSRYLARKHDPYDLRYLLQRNGKELTRESMVDIALLDNEWNCDGALNELVDTREKGFVEVLVRAMRSTKRLDSVYTSIVGINKLAKTDFKPLDVEGVLNWWKTATTNESYHSAYLPFNDLICAFRNRPKDQEIGVSLIANIELAREAVARYPNFMPARRHVLNLMTSLMKVRRNLTGEYKTFCEESLEVLRTSRNSKDHADYYLYRIECLGARDETEAEGVKVANEAIREIPDFESVAKKSGRFTPEFFDHPRIDWPSKRKVAKKPMGNPQGAKKPPVQFVKPQGCSIGMRDISSDNAVGYVSVKVKKGRRALTELPFVKSALVTSDKLSSLTGCEEDDEISWRPSNGPNVTVYRYRDGHWRNDNDDPADDVVIPMGEAVLYYDRKVDVESQIGFSGQIGGMK